MFIRRFKPQRVDRKVSIEHLSLVLASVFFCGQAEAQVTPIISSRMDRDPDLTFVEPDTFFPEGLRELWSMALQQDEADAKQLASRSIVIANQHGLRNWDSAKPFLIANLRDRHRGVRLSSAAALVALESNEAAGKLAEAADRDGLEMSQLVEPALAAWGFREREETWLKWASGAGHGQGRAKLAMQCLGDLKSTKAIPDLLKIVTDGKRASLRLAAAKSLGSFVREGLEESAQKLAAQGGRGSKSMSRVLAAKLLRSDTSESSFPLLVQLMNDDEPAVINAAAEQLLERAPESVIKAQQHILEHGDTNARLVLVRALASRPHDETIRLLGDRMDDASESVRSMAREFLAKISEDDNLRWFVTREARRMLSLESWRATEQAARLAVAIDDVESQPRLVELLSFDRPETYVTAAWALCELNPKEGLLESLEVAKKRFQLAEGGISHRNEMGYERQIAHLCLWFGIAKFDAAGPFLKSFVPKSNPLFLARRSAVWGLGYLYEGKPQAELIAQLKARIADVDSPSPEDNFVRQQGLIAIGRMNDKESVEFIRQWRDRESPGSEVGAGCCWALHHLVGEPLPKIDPVPGYRSGFFLERLMDK